jgi:leucyl aminopeptidase
MNCISTQPHIDICIDARGDASAPDVLLALGENQTYDCLVIGVYENDELSDMAARVDAITQGWLTQRLNEGDIQGKIGATSMLYAPSGGFVRILTVGLGKAEDFDEVAFFKAIQASWQALCHAQRSHVLWLLSQQRPNSRTIDWAIHHTLVEARTATYQFTRLKSTSSSPRYLPQTITFIVDTPEAEPSARATAKHALAMANGMDLTRDLANLPSNFCTPTYLAQTASQLAEDFHLKAEILDEQGIKTLKMGAFLSVAKGSSEPPRFIILDYDGTSNGDAPIVLVGKGVTFDSGGISIKPGERMDEMKYDMCGAASVLGTLRAVAEMKLPLRVIGIIPACENMPAGNANKPGDIVTSMSGQTIEVLNTDAEGRLLLCDALTYAERFKPKAVVDIATLTGACVIALGHHRSGLYARPENDSLAAALLTAADEFNDPAWRMPLDKAYQDQLKSNFADMGNIGGRPAGSVTAACFLSRFTKAYPWAHLDIAGTAWKSGRHKGATARPVPLLVKFLMDQTHLAKR